MRQLEVLLLHPPPPLHPAEGMLAHRGLHPCPYPLPPLQTATNHPYTWVVRELSVLTRTPHNEPDHFDLESNDSAVWSLQFCWQKQSPMYLLCRQAWEDGMTESPHELESGHLFSQTIQDGYTPNWYHKWFDSYISITGWSFSENCKVFLNHTA